MRWLPHHASLVSLLSLGNAADDQATADTVLELALQACARHAPQALLTAAPTAAPAAAGDGRANSTVGGSASAGAAAADACGALQSTASLPLRLTKFTSSDLPTTAVLRLLVLQSAASDLTLAMLHQLTPLTLLTHLHLPALSLSEDERQQASCHGWRQICGARARHTWLCKGEGKGGSRRSPYMVYPSWVLSSSIHASLLH